MRRHFGLMLGLALFAAACGGGDTNLQPTTPTTLVTTTSLQPDHDEDALSLTEAEALDVEAAHKFDMPADDEDEGSLAEAEVLDVEAAYIAEKFGMPVEVVRQQLDYQIAFGDLLNRIPEDIVLSQFAVAALDRFNPGTATIYFKGEVPPEVVSLVADAGVPGIQLQGGMKYSSEDMKALRRAVVATVKELGYSQLVLTIEPRTQRLELLVGDLPNPPFTTASELAEAIASRLDEKFQVAPEDLMVEIRPEW